MKTRPSQPPPMLFIEEANMATTPPIFGPDDDVVSYSGYKVYEMSVRLAPQAPEGGWSEVWSIVARSEPEAESICYRERVRLWRMTGITSRVMKGRSVPSVL